MKYPKGIKAVYDNGGETIDRYTVVFSSKKYFDTGAYKGFYHDAVFSSNNPTHPQGYYQHAEVKLIVSLGKKISWLSLPKSVRNLVNKERLYYV